MFRFFSEKHWFIWSWLGSFIILSSLWVQVEIDVKINEWFGVFYDMIQKALAEPNAVSIEEYFASLFSFITLAGMYIAVYVAISFFTAHFLFRWRTAMVEWYHSVYDKARKIEGASQRVQEDTIKFTRIMEGLGTSLIESIMILIQFIPILFGLSIGIPIFFFGDWEYGLIVGALIWTIGGTVFLIVLGLILRQVGVEYDLQKQEAAYRKILVIAEDDGSVRPKKIDELFDDVRKIHFLSYIRYLYFNIGRIAYLQANVLSAYVFLAPAIVAGAVTLGVMQQIIRAFGRVEGSMQYLLKAWPTIIELASVYKRLREFESKIKQEELIDEIEVVITPGSRLVGRKQNYFTKLAYEELFLLGMWRKGARFRTRLSKQIFKVGDVLLLGVRDPDEEDVSAKINLLGLMPIRSREISTLPSRSRFLKALVFFTTSILLAALNIINVLTAFLICVLGFVGIKILKSNLYRHIEWPIVIMLAAMIPIGQALESTGITAQIASGVVSFAGDLHVFWILMIILIITMLITDVINLSLIHI